MNKNETYSLYTAIELEKKFGSKYFYRQRIYRMAESKKIPAFTLKDQTCFIAAQVLDVFLNELRLKIEGRFLNIDMRKIRVFFDIVSGNKIIVDGIFGKGISINTQEESEEDLLLKIKHIVEYMDGEEHLAQQEEDRELDLTPLEDSPEINQTDNDSSQRALITNTLPEEIFWIKIDTGLIAGVEIKSFILISLPSIAQFIGIRPDAFIRWVSSTTFAGFVLSAHYKQIQGTQIDVPWKKGIVSGYNSFVPFELLPEIIVAFRQSGRTIDYPEKAELLYNLAKSTLSAVGLAISGNKSQAAEILARVGKGLGLDVADQIIGIFKQYESRDYQILTNKEFNSKVKEVGEDYAVATGKLTLGVTGQHASYWMLMGKAKKLPSKMRTSSREVMRQLSPSDGVGMTFGERHYIKDPDITEAQRTGRQGKEFYKRLKDVGLLDS